MYKCGEFFCGGRRDFPCGQPSFGGCYHGGRLPALLTIGAGRSSPVVLLVDVATQEALSCESLPTCGAFVRSFVFILLRPRL